MNNATNVFNKTFKVSGVTFKNRQEHLKQLYEMNLSTDLKKVEINHTTSDGYDCLMVLFNGLEVGVVPRQDVNYFQDNSYDYIITNFYIGSFIGDYGQKIYYARIFVHFFVKEKMLKYLPNPTLYNTSPNIAKSPESPTVTPPQIPTEPLRPETTEKESELPKLLLKENHPSVKPITDQNKTNSFADNYNSTRGTDDENIHISPAPIFLIILFVIILFFCVLSSTGPMIFFVGAFVFVALFVFLIFIIKGD